MTNSYKANLDLSVTSQGFVEGNAQLEKIETNSIQAERATESFRKTTKEMERTITGSTKATKQAERATDGLTQATREAGQATQGLGAESKRAVPPMGGLGAGAKKTGKSFGNLRMIAGGLGYQLQDIAVQAQSGTDKFIILGQQGSQVASVFGPGGIVFGALLAVGSAIVGAGSKAFQTGKQIQELKDEALQLTDAFSISESGILAYDQRLQRLAETAPGVARALFDIKKAQLELEQTLTKGALRENLGEFDELTKIFDKRASETFEQSKTSALFLKSAMQDLREEYGATDEQLINVSRSLDNFNDAASVDTASALVDSLRGLTDGSDDAKENIAEVIALLGQYIETSTLLDKSSDPYQSQNKSVRSLITSLELEAATLNKTARERDLYVAGLNEATEGQLEAINAAYDKIEADQSATVLERLEAQLASEEERINESYTRRREIIMENTVEGSEQQRELLLRNLEQWEEDYDQHQAKLTASADKETAKRQALEIKTNSSIQAMQRATVDSGISLLKRLADGHENASRVILLLEGALNIGRVYQNTAVAIMRAYSDLGPVAGPAAAAKIATLGNIQAGIVAANTALSIAGTGGGGGSAGGSSSVSTGTTEPSPTAQPEGLQPLENTRPVTQIIFNGPVNGMDAEHLAVTLRDHLDDTDFLLVSRESRNGQELAA